MATTLWSDLVKTQLSASFVYNGLEEMAVHTEIVYDFGTCRLCEEKPSANHVQVLVSDLTNNCSTPYEKLTFNVCRSCLVRFITASTTQEMLDCTTPDCVNVVCRLFATDAAAA